MNLPTSKPVIENVFLDIIEPDKLLLDLNNKKFTGYLYLVIHSEHGFEENFILFLKGDVVGSIYINNKYNLEIYGFNAFKLSINSLGFKEGLLNLYELSEEQLKLVLIFNDKIKYNFKINSKSTAKQNFKYNESLFNDIFKDKIHGKIQLRSELFDKFNVNELLRYKL
jgi:hypothetical protein